MAKKCSFTEQDLLVAINKLRESNKIISEQNIIDVMGAGSAPTVKKYIAQLMEKGNIRFSALDHLGAGIKRINRDFVENNKHKLQTEHAEKIIKEAESEARAIIRSEEQVKFNELEQKIRKEFKMKIEEITQNHQILLLKKELELKNEQIEFFKEILKK
ncbi:TPA: hypothetical protein ACN35C_004687 [Vibrio parahaemolyticus]